MDASTRARSTSGVPVPKASARTTRATSKLLADQQSKIAFPSGPLSSSSTKPIFKKRVPEVELEKAERGPSRRPERVQDDDEEEVLRDSVEATP
jgi:hypothetical protein